MRLDIFYNIASKEKQELICSSKKEATNLRLRMYNLQRRYNLPKLTILVKGSTLIAGPEGFDLAEIFERIVDPKTIQRMEEINKQNDDEHMQRLLKIQEDREKRKAFNPFDLLDIGKKKKEEEKEEKQEKEINPYEKEGNKENE